MTDFELWAFDRDVLFDRALERGTELIGQRERRRNRTWTRVLSFAGPRSSPPEPDLRVTPRRRLPVRTVAALLVAATLSAATAGLIMAAQVSTKPASASVIVTMHSSAAGAFSGRVPKKALSKGHVNWSDVPEYVAVAGPGGTTIGYVRKDDIDGSIATIGPMNGGTYSPVCGTDGVVVYDADHVTVIGALYPGIGYVPLGAAPDCSKYVPATTIDAP
jgi:hypothetical protein